MLLSEIDTLICGKVCLQEYCQEPRCKCFWKLQNEIFSGRERLAKFAEKSKKKIKNYESEIALLRASKVENDKKSFSDEISDTFGHHFTMMRDLEHQIKQSFCKTLHRYERENEQQKLRIWELEKELEKIKKEKLSQKNENESLIRMIGKVQRDLRPTSRMD